MSQILILLFTSMFIYADPGPSDLKCISLEGIGLGCVPSTVHQCYMNKKVDNPEVGCEYGKNWQSQIKAKEGPIDWQCSAYKTEQVVEQTPEGPVTRTVSTCIDYAPPSCDEICTGCYADIVTKNIGIQRGCIVCTRTACPDEPPAEYACPPAFEDYAFASGSPKCGTPTRCPATAVDPLGKTQTVNVRSPAVCNEAAPPPPGDPGTPKHCPWKNDERSKTGCEPIRPENKNP